MTIVQQPPPLNTCLRYPITTGIAILAVAATLRYWTGADIERFVLDNDRWLFEPWRLVTWVLFHGDILHLAFNLYWLWVFGAVVEAQFGSGRMLAICITLAAGSGLAEMALFHGGIGLSGVNYGLFGLLWVLSKSDRRFRGAMDRQTAQFLVGWFFFCIAATVADLWHIANVAHAMGFILGALLGWTIAANTLDRRIRNAALLATVLLFCMLGGSVARPYINLSKDIGLRYADEADQALIAKDPQRAVALYKKAIIVNPNVARWWHNLGVAYHQLGQDTEAHAALQHAAQLDPEVQRDQ